MQAVVQVVAKGAAPVVPEPGSIVICKVRRPAAAAAERLSHGFNSSTAAWAQAAAVVFDGAQQSC
jgi:hypothetical protein